MEFFTFILYFIFFLESPKILALEDVVRLSHNWPVPIDHLVSFTISKEINSNSVLIVDILNKTLKDRKSIKIAKSNYIDWITDYYTIKRDIAKSGTSSFTIKMSFRRNSDGTDLIFRWFPLGLSDTNSTEVNSEANIIYSKKIQLRAKWKIKVTVEVEDNSCQRALNTEEKYFQIGKTVKITCSAYDGLPKARVYVNGINSKRFREIAFDENLNTWVGYLTLTLSDHNTNVTCSVGGTDNVESVQIKVNHVPTILSLEPEYNGYTKNGSKIRCISSDGYPSPIIKWDYVLIKNHSNPKSLYQINGDTLIINPNVQTGTELIFNCTAVYTNPFGNEVEIIRKVFKFEVGEMPAAAKDVLNSKIEMKIKSKRQTIKKVFAKLKLDEKRKDVRLNVDNLFIFQKAFEELQRKCDEQTSKIDLLNDEIVNLRNVDKCMREDVDKLKLDGERNKKSIGALEKKCEQQNEQIKQFNNKYQQIENKLNNGKQERKNKEKDLMRNIDEMKNKQTEMTTRSNKIDETMKNGEFVWRIDNIKDKMKNAKRGINSTIYSDSFYTHKHGYKMCLRVDPGGDGAVRGFYLSVYAYLMKGEFDDNLEWPFIYDVTISLINQQTGLAHVSLTEKYDHYLVDYNRRKKPYKKRSGVFGSAFFLKFKEFSNNPNLMLNNQIIIKCSVNFPS